MSRHVVVTGASAGFGAAIARKLAGDGGAFRLSLGARRVERLAGVVPDAFHHGLDVTDEASVETFLQSAIEANGPIDVLINNAGLARGTERVADATGEAWREMIETNVLGVLHCTRRVVPAMIERGGGDIVFIGSIAGHDAYPGGSVYCATKNALTSIARSLRRETLGTGIRVSNVEPGLAETEFSLVRFRGDADKASKVYDGTQPLQAEDIADCVHFAITRPRHVNIDSILVLATDQATATEVHRRPASS